MAPQGSTVQSKTITVAFRAATCIHKAHSWIFPEVRQALKGEKKPKITWQENCQRDIAKGTQHSREGAGMGKGASPAGLVGTRDGGRRIPSNGICPVPSTWDPCGSLAQKATSSKALELAAFSQPKNESKSFGTPLVQPFLGGLRHS